MDCSCCVWWSRRRSENEVDEQLLRSTSVDRGEYRPPPVTPLIPNVKQFKLLKTIGKGAFGKVFQVKDKKDGEVYALKVVAKAAIKTNRDEARILAEAHILRRVNHPFCVSLKYTFQSRQNLFYVFEFVGGGMLFYHLRKDKCFDEPRSRFYIGETILALEYLHSLGIIFRDLKPENCLLYPDGHICLTDFGAAKDLGDSSQQTATFCGTPSYIAPEILRGEHYSLPVDWWTCGILLYEMLVGKPPFMSKDRVQLYKQVLRGTIQYPDTLSENAVSLIRQLLERDPGKRLGCSSFRGATAASIKDHPFFLSQTDNSDSASAPDCFLYVKWTWTQLERRKVRPPFIPILVGTNLIDLLNHKNIDNV